MKNSTIRLRDDEVSLENYKIGDICEIVIKGKMMGQKVEEDYSDSLCCSPEETTKKKEPKKYVEFTIEVQKVKQEEPKKDDGFFNKDKRVEYGSTKRSGE